MRGFTICWARLFLFRGYHILWVKPWLALFWRYRYLLQVAVEILSEYSSTSVSFSGRILQFSIICQEGASKRSRAMLGLIWLTEPSIGLVPWTSLWACEWMLPGGWHWHHHHRLGENQSFLRLATLVWRDARLVWEYCGWLLARATVKSLTLSLKHWRVRVNGNLGNFRHTEKMTNH